MKFTSAWRMTTISWLVSFVVISCIILPGCETGAEREKRLARTYCSSCHVFPEPGLLDRHTWDSTVLPQMAFRMGFSNSKIMWEIPRNDLDDVLKLLPARPMVTEEEWEAIRHYYLTNAPDSLYVSQTVVTDTLIQFTPHLKKMSSPYITTLKADSSNHTLYVGTLQAMLYKLNERLEITDSVVLESTPSCIRAQGDSLSVLLMGNIYPNDQPTGRLVHVNMRTHGIEVVIDTLRRPVYVEQGILLNEKYEASVICSFGHFKGALQLYGQRDAADFYSMELNVTPGARKAVITDFDKNGVPDVVALMSQGDERLVLYTNKGRNEFEEKTLLRFPPVYGSSYFDLADFNSDGHPDILYTNGDNADYSTIIKPYHGVKLFLNDGNSNFKEAWSFTMPGAWQANAADFDGDGDLDIAAIAFFPDRKHHPEQSFLYFQNKGNNQFTPQYHKVMTGGRWLVMDTCDPDGDGDTDLVLGAFNSKGLGMTDNTNLTWKNETPLLWLENMRY